MCTAIHLSDERLFGRTLDYEKGFGEEVIFTPREFMRMGDARNRYSMLGTGVVMETSTLYFDGMNEWGLCGAALNFPEYARYRSEKDKKAEVPSGLFLSFVLGFCKSITQLKDLLSEISITDDTVKGMPATPLHWIFADAKGCVTVESTERGLEIFENPYGVLTNSPDFAYHTTRLAEYMALHSGYPDNKLTENRISTYSRGMGAVGLPGDFSSASRFIRALFVKENSISKGNEQGGINRMKHILSSVSVPMGCVMTRDNEPVSTRYSCVMDSENLTYYFCSYDNPILRGVRLHPEQTDMQVFPIHEKENIVILN